MPGEDDRKPEPGLPGVAPTVDAGAAHVLVVEAWAGRISPADEAELDGWLRRNDRPFDASGAELATARAVCDALARTVARATGRMEEVDAAIDALLDAGMPGDPGWQDVLASVREAPPGHESYKLLSLARYRKHLLRAVATGPESDPETQVERPPPLAPPAAPGPAQPPSGLVRLERSRRIALVGEHAGPVGIWLAGRRFDLVLGPGASLADDRGRTGDFKEGANLVGRVPYAEVVILEDYADVSRRHLVVEVRGRVVVALTDISSRGTCVPAALVGEE